MVFAAGPAEAKLRLTEYMPRELIASDSTHWSKTIRMVCGGAICSLDLRRVIEAARRRELREKEQEKQSMPRWLRTVMERLA